MNRLLRYLYLLVAAARPAQLMAVGMVYLFGLVIAMANGHPFRPESAIGGFLSLIPVAMSIHYVNEYADHGTDARTSRTPFSGGSGALQKTGLPRTALRTAAWAFLGAGGFLALVLTGLGTLTPVSMGVLVTGAFFGWMYSVRPLALAWRGWGEIDNAALGGVVLPVFGYLTLAPRLELSAVLAVLPFGILVFANLLATTWPDRAADAAVGKFTLATRWRPRMLRFAYWTAAASSFILLPLLADWVFPPIVIWACLATVPVVIWGAVAYTRRHSPLPTVAAMIVMLIAHTLAWATLIG